MVLVLREDIDVARVVTQGLHELLDARVLGSFKFGFRVDVLHLTSPHDILLPCLDLLGQASDVLEAVKSQDGRLAQDLHALVMVVTVDHVLSLVSRLSQDPIANQE